MSDQISLHAQAAVKIQVTLIALFRGYTIRKHFLSVKVRFERILRSIDGDSVELTWPFFGPCKPRIKDKRLAIRLADLEKSKQLLEEELYSIRKNIQARKEYLIKYSGAK